MFYNGHGYDRVPKERVLGQVDFAWTAPGSSECGFRIGREQKQGVSVADGKQT
jgi:hypothetical protein